MPVFKTFFKIAKKNIGASSIYIAIFAIICVMFASMGGKSAEFKLSACNIVIFDQDNTESSENLIKYLSGIHKVETSYEDDREMLQDYLYYRKIDYVLYIEKGFENTGKLSNIKRSDTNVGTYIDGQIENYMGTMKAALETGCSEQEAFALTEEALNTDEIVTVSEAKQSYDTSYYFYLYLPYVIMMVMFMAMTPVYIAFNKKETKDRINISSFSHRRKVSELVLATVCLSIGVWLIFTLIYSFMYGGFDSSKCNLMCMVNSFVYTIVSASMVSVLGCFSLKSGALNMVSNIIGLALAFLGGVFVPIEFFGKSIQNVSKFMPTYWYEMANDSIYKDKVSSLPMADIGMQLLFVLAFYAIALLMSRKKVNN